MKFYKIIESANIERSRLKLPIKFEKRYGKKLPGHVTLVIPTRAEWRVRVVKNADGVWLKGKGWDEFVDSLGLELDDFLMFEYDAMSAVFHVVVMGLSASEIKYPALATDSDDDVVVISGGASELEHEFRSKKAPSNESESFSGDSVEIIENEREKKNENHQAVKKNGYHICRGETTFNNEGMIQRVVQGRNVYHYTSEAEQAFARARAFKAVEPAFIVALQPSYLSRTAELTNNSNCHLLVPRSFILEYFDLAVKVVTLETGDRTLSVAYRVFERMVYFTNGWKKFAEDNCLAISDVCLFELTRGAKNALKVSIFRVTGDDEVPVSPT